MDDKGENSSNICWIASRAAKKFSKSQGNATPKTLENVNWVNAQTRTVFPSLVVQHVHTASHFPTTLSTLLPPLTSYHLFFPFLPSSSFSSLVRGEKYVANRNALWGAFFSLLATPTLLHRIKKNVYIYQLSVLWVTVGCVSNLSRFSLRILSTLALFFLQQKWN